MAFINKNIAPGGWVFAPLISISSVGTPPFISFLGFSYIELQMDKFLPKSECRLYLDGMTLTCLSTDGAAKEGRLKFNLRPHRGLN